MWYIVRCQADSRVFAKILGHFCGLNTGFDRLQRHTSTTPQASRWYRVVSEWNLGEVTTMAEVAIVRKPVFKHKKPENQNSIKTIELAPNGDAYIAGTRIKVRYIVIEST